MKAAQNTETIGHEPARTLNTNLHEQKIFGGFVKNIKKLFVLVRVCLCLFVVSSFFVSSPASAQSSMDYYRELARRDVATVGDAVHVVARGKGYTGPTDVYKEVLYLYKEHGIKFRRDIVKLEQVRLTKGNAAHMLMSSMGVKGWVMQRIFKGSQRYALREAVYLKLLPADSTVHQRMSGSELLGFLARIAEYTGGQP